MSVYGYEEIIASAVDNEVEAFKFYSAVGEKVADVTLKAIFQELAAEEQKHREFLQELLSQPQDLDFVCAEDCKVAESTEKTEPTIWMKPSEAIGLAMKNEEDAMKKYDELARVSAEGPQKAMFESLARMEQGHKVRLEAIYTDMAFAESW